MSESRCESEDCPMIKERRRTDSMEKAVTSLTESIKEIPSIKSAHDKLMGCGLLVCVLVTGCFAYTTQSTTQMLNMIVKIQDKDDATLTALTAVTTNLVSLTEDVRENKEDIHELYIRIPYKPTRKEK